MATSTDIGKGAALNKADYLKRYLSSDEAGKKSKEKKIKKKRPKPTGRGMKIVDDDIDWRQLAANNEENKEDDEDDEAPMIADVIDERPDEIKQLEVFRTSKWKVLGGGAGFRVLCQNSNSVLADVVHVSSLTHECDADAGAGQY